MTDGVLTVQALFLHERLVFNALDGADKRDLELAIVRHRAVGLAGYDRAQTSAYEEVVARLTSKVRELAVAIVASDLKVGEMVTLTQDFYVRRDSEERGSFTAKLDIDRQVTLKGGFSTSRLIGATGQSETFGHRRFAMLAYVLEADLAASSVTLQPLFIGWRLMRLRGQLDEPDDRHELWPQQLGQFSKISGKRATAKDRETAQNMREAEVKNAFAEIIGEPFVGKDWGGETSDLYTSRLSSGGRPMSAAFAFKGRGLRGPLYVGGMGSRGDQGLRLAQEDVDLLVVQHHSEVKATVRNLMAAVSRQHGRLYMIIDGEATAVILRSYGKLP